MYLLPVIASNLLFELNVDPAYGVYADVTLTIDTTNTDDVDGAVDVFESAVADDWKEVEIESVFITSSPTLNPSAVPSIAPTTVMPSAQPSVTGLVVTIDVTRRNKFQGRDRLFPEFVFLRRKKPFFT